MANNVPYRAVASRPSNISEYRLFPSDYFSGCDIALYFGNIYIDEITSLQFMMQEQILPLYGYADFRYRDIPHGNRIVIGQFSINFKESAYIYLILDKIKRGTNNVATQNEWTQIDVEEMYERYKTGETGYNGRDTFETLADYYERAMWGGEKTDAGIIDFKEMMRKRRTEPFFDQGFTITVGYGQNHTAFAARKDGTYQKVLGAYYEADSEHLPIEETVKTITGVHLFKVDQRFDTSGQPIQEVYNFFAKDIDNFDDLIIDSSQRSLK
jgi:hypothetical protein